MTSGPTFDAAFAGGWYVVGAVDELRRGPLAREVLGEWLVVFAGPDGAPAALQDRCMHRAGRLSDGVAARGCVRCPYHGWTYDPDGAVVAVPAEGDAPSTLPARRAVAYAARAHQGYVYVRLGEPAPWAPSPPDLPAHGAPGYRTVRLVHDMDNDVTSCVENFIDVPHTVFVHPGIFRVSRRQHLRARVVRDGGRVEVRFVGETDNLGWFRRFLNPQGGVIEHVDRFFAPNLTSVEYRFGPRRHLFITSQSVPVSPDRTRVYTDLTYDFGPWTPFAGPILTAQARAVIRQDQDILRRQRAVVNRYGARFAHTAADVVHLWVESIRDAISEGRDPAGLPRMEREIDLWV